MFNDKWLTSRKIDDRSPYDILGILETQWRNERCDSRSKILPNDIQTKIFFISINYVYFKFRATSLLISVNMIFTNEEDLRYDAKWQYTSPWVTPLCHFVLMLKL